MGGDDLVLRGSGVRTDSAFGIPHSALLRFAKQKPLGALGAAITLVLIFMAAFHQQLATIDPNAIDPNAVLKAPSSAHYFGTDAFGRDIYSRVVYGAWISLQVSIIAVAIGTVLGTIIGVISGYVGGTTDMVLQRIVDAALSFPGLILAIALVGLVGPSVKNVSIAIGLVTFPSLSRIVRGPVLSIKEQAYVEAARATGAGGTRIMLRHILPNIMAVIIVVATARFGSAILVESSLSFLGLGPPPPTPTWGSMLSGDAIYIMQTAWWLAVFPGAAITLVVLGFNLFGDALRDVWDPRLRGRCGPLPRPLPRWRGRGAGGGVDGGRSAMSGTYQSSTRHPNRFGRRAALRGAAGAGGLAAAFAIACGDSKKEGTGATGAGGSGSPQAQATVHPEVTGAKQGGTLNLDFSDDPISLDNHRQEPPGSVQSAQLVYNHLLRRWEDFLKAPGVINIDDELAQSWEQVDKLTYKFNLVRNAKWHDLPPLNGRGFKSSDVKYSIERMKGTDPELRTRSAMEPVDKIETPDDYTVIVTTKEPFAAFINNAGHTWNVIMAPEFGETPDVNRRAVGTGPWIFREWQRGVVIRYERNPEYFRKGQPFFDRVLLRTVPDRAARATNFRSGETDVWGGAPPTVPYETIEEMKKAVPDVQEIRREGSNNSGTKAYFNTTAQPFNDKRVRQAFLYGADYAAMIKIFGGLAQRAAPMPLASIYGLKETDLPKTDVAKAKQLLEAAGYTADKPLKVTTSFSTEYSGPAVSQIMQQLMKAVGVDVQLNQMENAAWITKVYRGGQEYQMSSHGDWSWEDPDRGLYSYFHSKGVANNTHYANPQADSLLEKQRGEFDVEARKKTVRELQLLLVDDAPDVWLVSTGGIELIRNRFKNYKQMQMGNTNGYRQYEFCWYDPVPR